MFLTPQDLEALTGYKRPTAMVRWLETRAWQFERTRCGWPVISRAYAEAKMSGKAAPAVKVGPRLDRA